MPDAKFTVFDLAADIAKGYSGGFMSGAPVEGGTIKLHYDSSAAAERAFEVITDLIDGHRGVAGQNPFVAKLDALLEENGRLRGLLLDADAALLNLGACAETSCDDPDCNHVRSRIRAEFQLAVQMNDPDFHDPVSITVYDRSPSCLAEVALLIEAMDRFAMVLADWQAGEKAWCLVARWPNGGAATVTADPRSGLRRLQQRIKRYGITDTPKLDLSLIPPQRSTAFRLATTG